MADSEQQDPNGDATIGEHHDPFGAEKEEDQNALPGEAAGADQQDLPMATANEAEPDLTGAATDAQPQQAVGVAPVPRKLPLIPLVAVGFALLLLLVIFFLFQSRPKQNLQSDDLGPGIANGPGLKGHLVTKWEGKAKYQLRLEPIYARQIEGFTRVVANPPQPYSINIRLLDATGFALCGKEILFPFDAAKAAPGAKKANLEGLVAGEVQREHGQDIFQSQTTDEGLIEAVNAQGDLPCSVKDYQRADYWDFTTNFPNLADQEALLNGKRIVPAPVTETNSQAPVPGQSQNRKAAAHRKPYSKPMGDFYIEGDERVSDYDPPSGTLEAGRSFFIDRKTEQAIAADWATNSSLIHFSCDQHETCTLTHPGSTVVLHARLSH
jgi:hypothetical protein